MVFLFYANSYSILITLHQNIGKPDSSLYYLALLQKFAHEAEGPDASTIKSNYNSSAGLFYKKSGNPKLALPYFIEALLYLVSEITAYFFADHFKVFHAKPGVKKQD